MKPLFALLLALIFIATAKAQDTRTAPPSPVPPKAEPVDPVETVQPAIPVGQPPPPAPAPATIPTTAKDLPAEGPPTFTQDQVRQIETTLKKQMMLVGMGGGVVGLLLGMMIGRKTAPQPTNRRY